MATLVVYPDAGTGATTVDGYVINERAASSWADLRDDANGTSAFPSYDGAGADGYIFARGTGAFALARGFTLFDTSPLTTSAVVSAAVLSIKPRAKTAQTDWYMALCACAPAANNNLAVGDFSAGMTLDSPTEFMTRIISTDFTTGTYKDITLNASGIAAISLTGITKYMARTDYDIDSVLPAGGGSQNRGMGIYYADNSGTSNDPYLTITYTASPPDTGNFFPFLDRR